MNLKHEHWQEPLIGAPGRSAASAINIKNQGKSVSQMMGSAFLAAWLLTGCTTSLHTANTQSSQDDEQAQIQQRLQEVFAAAESKDFNRLDSYHLYGSKFTKFTGSSPYRLDATAGQKGEHDGLAAAQGLKMRAEALKIDVFHDVGIATFILDYSVESGGEVVRREERSTLVFVKEAGDWKIAHEHLSPINR